MATDYEKFIHDWAKPVVEAGIEKGLLLGWVAYRVVIPGPGEMKYNYTQVYAYRDFDSLEKRLEPLDINRFIKGSTPEQFGARLRSMRREYDSMVLAMLDTTTPKQ